MATVQTLTPTAVTLTTGAGSPWVVTGAATAWEAVADASDSSYINHPNSNDNPTAEFTAFADYTLLSNERCRAVRLAGRGGSDFGVTTSLKRTADYDVASSLSLDSGYPTPVTEYGAWDTTKPAGGEWLQADINALSSKLFGSNAVGGFNGSRVHRYVIELDVIKQPVVAITAPTQDQITNKQPVVSWTYTGNGEAQTVYHVKVFTKAVAEGGGFDPATSAAVYNPGTVASSGTSQQVTSGLDYGSEYYAYVRVAKDFNGVSWYSSWVGMRFKVDSLPVAAVTAPVGAVTTTSKPPVSWTFTDADPGHTQESYEVRIYKRPGAAWPGGFNPDTTTETAVWWTYETYSTVTTAEVLSNLENLATFRAYVRLREASGSLVHERSAWAFSDFNLNLTPPIAPIDVTATPDVPNARMEVRFTQQEGATVPEHYEIERSDDGGVTWARIRNYFYARTAHGTVSTVLDHEAPFNVVSTYRVFAVDTSGSSPVYSTASASGTGTLAVKTVWLKYYQSPSQRNRTFPVEESWHAINKRRVRAVKEPLGRAKPIVIRGTALHESFTVTFLIIGQTQFDDLMFFLQLDGTFLYQSPKRKFWVELSGDVTVNEHLWDDLHGEADVWRITVPLQEVDAL